MDNVTHAITGIIAAEAVVHLRLRLGDDVTPAWTRAAWVISALGQNMADADAIYTGITEGPLGYLLHHRGHTHTLVLAPVMALVAYAIGGNATRAWREGATRADRLWLAALALAGAVGHLLLDLSNDYGIHPFWPLDDGWIYGDTIFIVEPLFWAATLPILVRASRSVVARATFGALLLGILAVTWFSGHAPWPSAVAVTLLAAIASLLAWRTRPAARVAFAFGASGAILGAFAAGSAAAGANLRDALARAYPTFSTVDVPRSPRPATPFCWEAVAVQRSEDGVYALRLARVSAWPGLVRAARCGAARGEAPGALPPGAVDEPAVIVVRDIQMPLTELRARAERCDVHAFLRWSRAPFFARSNGGGLAIGDLRYVRGEVGGFAAMPIPDALDTCPERVPPWRPPRAGFLE